MRAALLILLAWPALAHEGLPLGDRRVAAVPGIGLLFACPGRAAPGGGPAPPWIVGDRWFPDRKPQVRGEVAWPDALLVVTRDGDRRVIVGNGLPQHTTGIFPVRRDDPAWRFDPNPNRIGRQMVTLDVPADPVPAARPSCVPLGPIGYALSGVAIYNAIDAARRDAAAHEVQDRCNGHPDPASGYHYHGWSPCLSDTVSREHSALVGYALDGFGIYGPRGEGGVALGNADLDECHGHTHEIEWDGRRVALYHYHFTPEFPYAIGCFRGTPAAR